MLMQIKQLCVQSGIPTESFSIVKDDEAREKCCWKWPVYRLTTTTTTTKTSINKITYYLKDLEMNKREQIFSSP